MSDVVSMAGETEEMPKIHASLETTSSVFSVFT